MKIIQRRRTRRAGFTLTEMLIVLAILVMLVAMVVPRFMGARKKADIQAAQTQIGLFRGALENYYMDTKCFPTTEQGLQSLLTAPADGGAGAEGAEGSAGSAGSVVGWNGPYVNKDTIGLDPWNRDWQYAYPPERGSTDMPDIWSFGPDGEDNTEDDICSWTVSGGGEAGAEGQPKENLDVDVDVKLPSGPPAPSGGGPAGPPAPGGGRVP
ncbi:MAG TPA: type II secretion system major pseudopilin GspG [Candidatus Anammoximicrobium sp.]|nr:type II secretion system major pseudopilin GspG [Candidatus Anammoximicrobium sp.]